MNQVGTKRKARRAPAEEKRRGWSAAAMVAGSGVREGGWISSGCC